MTEKAKQIIHEVIRLLLTLLAGLLPPNEKKT